MASVETENTMHSTNVLFTKQNIRWLLDNALSKGSPPVILVCYIYHSLWTGLWSSGELGRGKSEKASLPPFPFPFLAIFSPNREPVHRLHISLRRVPRITVICCRLETKTSSNRQSNASKGNSNSEPDLRTPLRIRQMNIVNVQSVNRNVSLTVSSCKRGIERFFSTVSMHTNDLI